MKNYQFFCDFDGTITKEDTLNKFLHDYAKAEWLEVEDRWIKGEIGSRQCIEEQMQLFPFIHEKVLNDFIDSIEIDKTFPAFLKYLRQENIDFYIVSDGFDLFIQKILERNKICDVKIFSNKLKFDKNKGSFETSFPNTNVDCKRQSGVCKCNVLKSNRIVTKGVLYAGDGLSDYCVCNQADILFAKGALLEYCKNTRMNNLIGFSSFVEIEEYIKRL